MKSFNYHGGSTISSRKSLALKAKEYEEEVLDRSMAAMLAKRKDGTWEKADGHISVFSCPACGDKMITDEAEQIIMHDKPMCPEWAQYTENWKGYGNG